MSIGQKIVHQTETATGAARKFFGRATGNARLPSRGHLDQAGGNIKRAQDRAADAYRRLTRAMAGPAHRTSRVAPPSSGAESAMSP
jgi:uncharacterized protein YjbJ (UPF0337 family)